MTDAKAGGRWAVVDDQTHHGDRSMRLIKTAPGIGNSDDAFNLATTPAIHQQVTFPAAGSYAFSAWMKADRKVRTWMMVGWDKFVPVEVGTDWQRYEITAHRSSAGSSFVRIYLMQQGTLWVDAVQLNAEAHSSEAFEAEATYENGVLKLDGPLPLRNHERVKVRIQRR